MWMIKLNQLTRIDDHHFIVVHDCIEPMGDGEYGAVSEVCVYSLLNEHVSSVVRGGERRQNRVYISSEKTKRL